MIRYFKFFILFALPIMVVAKQDPKAYWTEESKNQINRSALDGSLFDQYHTESNFPPRGIDIDTINNVAYWTNNWGQIRKGTIDATGLINVVDFISEAIDIPRENLGLALDVAAGKVYWASNWDQSLKVADLFAADPTSTIQSLSKGHFDIRSVAVDVTNKKLYYTDNFEFGATAMIFQSDLDGTNELIIFSLPDMLFTDLKLDVANDKIYWSGSVGIFSANLSDIAKTVKAFAVQGEAYGIDLDIAAGQIYWVDKGIPSFEPAQIGRANFDGTKMEILHSGSPNILDPRFIALDIPSPAAVCASLPTANAGRDLFICEDTNLNVIGIIGGSASSSLWTTSGDGTFANSSSLTSAYALGVNDIAKGSVTLTLTTNDPDGAGPCLAASDDVVISIEALQTVDVGLDQTVCSGSVVSLTATVVSSGYSDFWTTNGDGIFDDPDLFTTNYTPGTKDLIIGSVTLTFTATSIDTCPDVTDDLTVTFSQPIVAVDQSASLNVSETITIDPTNGATITPGDVITTTLLTNPQKGTAVVNANGTIDYTALQDNVGPDSFDFQICNQCNLCSVATVNVNINNSPPVVEIPPEVARVGETITIDVISRISDDNGNLDLSTLKILVQPLSGARASFDTNNNLIVDYSGLKFVGSDQLTIEVCDLVGLCTQEIIFIEVAPPSVIVYNAVSPNGDGKHDFLEIENVEFFPDNQVKILNRWGAIVFEIKGYDNANNKFNGKANKGGQGELPSGTYYYHINLGNGSPEINGHLSLRK